MEQKKTIDLAITILCGLIILIAIYGIGNEELGMLIIALTGVGFAVFLFLYLADVAKTRALRDEAPEFDDGSITELALLNEEEKPMTVWELFGKTALVIGKDIGENHVEINLNQSPYAAMIDIEHAVLNYADGCWYIEDLGSKNGIVLQKKADGRKYKLSADQPCKLDRGDVIIVGLIKLLTR